MSQMLPPDPSLMGAPPPGAPPEDPGMAAGGPGLGPEMGAPPPGGAAGGLSPDLIAALSGGGAPGADTNSTELMGEGPLAGEDASLAEEPAGGDDPVSLVREAIGLLRRAGEADSDDVRSHLIDKVQADLQQILSKESQKTSKLQAALGG